GPMIARVVRTRRKLPDVVGNLADEAVMQIPRQNEYRLVQLVPEIDQHLPFVEENGPRIVLVGRTDGPSADVWHHEIDARYHKDEVGVTVLDTVHQPLTLLPAEHRNVLVRIAGV